MNASHGGAALKLVFVLAVLGACLSLAWMLFLPLAAARILQGRTGCGVTIESLYCNPFSGQLELRGAVVSNPPDYPRRDFIKLRELRIEARPGALAGGRWEIDDAAVDLAELTVVRDSRGRVNVRAFQERLSGPPLPPPPARAPAKESRGFVIKHLAVRIDRLRLVDYTLPKPEAREYQLNFSRTYENVASARQLALPLADALGNVAGVVAGSAPETTGMLGRAGDTLRDAARKAGDAMKGLLESLEKTFRN